jgi:hypothetical protein
VRKVGALVGRPVVRGNATHGMAALRCPISCEGGAAYHRCGCDHVCRPAVGVGWLWCCR